VARQLVAVDKPVIAAIQGAAVGAGLSYALACDRRFADTTTKMSAIFTNVGVTPDCGISYFLPRLVGLSNALMMVETGRMFKAEQCKELGLIDELVPEGQAYEAALVYAKELAQRASVAVDMARRMIHMASAGATLDDILDYEGHVGVIVASSADAKEGTQSFMEKRKPAFRGL
jgi:2-(1,2-epoxy-1,2-dihydrophenyl)acetyl-CoA isomerase